jgi:hypothetical protein
LALAASMKVSLVGNLAEAWYQRNVSQELEGLKMMLSVLGGLGGLSGFFGVVSSGSRFSFHMPVYWYCSESKTGMLFTVLNKVLSSEIAAPF